MNLRQPGTWNTWNLRRKADIEENSGPPETPFLMDDVNVEPQEKSTLRPKTPDRSHPCFLSNFPH